MMWPFNRRASASVDAMASVMEEVEKAQEHLRERRLNLEKVIHDMKEDRKHALGE
jgi:uncharacterized protein YaaN involved in tellurite resistance